MANFKACRRVSASIESLQHNDSLGRPDEIVERLVGRGLYLFMSGLALSDNMSQWLGDS